MTGTFGPGASREAQLGLYSNELTALLAEAQQSLREAAEQIGKASAAMPQPDAEFVGHDEDDNVELVMQGSMRITELDIHNDPESAADLSTWLTDAYRNAVEQAFDEDAIDAREREAKPMDLPHAQPPSYPLTPEGMPTQEVFDSLDEQERHVASLIERVEAGKSLPEDITGVDEGRHVTVHLRRDGSFKGVDADERWLDSVRANAVAGAILEALGAAYEQLDAHKREMRAG